MSDTKTVIETLPNDITVTSTYTPNVPFATMGMVNNSVERTITVWYTPAHPEILRELLSRVHGLKSNIPNLDILYLVTGHDATLEFTPVTEILDDPSHPLKTEYLKALDVISNYPEFQNPIN